MRTLNFGASLPFACVTTCRFACPPVGADQVFTQPTRTFTSGLPADWSPAPPPDITTGATGQVPLAGLSPARTPTSFAAPLRSGLCCPSPSSLIRPHASHSGAHRDFTAGRLIPDAFAVPVRLGDPRVVPCFRWSFGIDMSPSETPGFSSTACTQFFVDDTGLRLLGIVSAPPTPFTLRFP